jgi:hypothetical protein
MGNQDDSNDVEVNRRDILKATTAGGLSLTGIASVVSASATDDHIEQVLNSEKVQSIREAVGEFDVIEVDKKLVKTEEFKLVGTWVKTNLGTLAYGETEDGTTIARLEYASLSENPDLRHRLPVRYRDVPWGADLALLGRESSVYMIRTVTDQERLQLKQAVPKGDGDFITAGYSSDINGYTVVTEETEYRIGVNGHGISSQNVNEVVKAQGCVGACGACASWAVSKGLCYWSCLSAVSGIGAVACLLCIANTNIGLIYAFDPCEECYNCIF